MRNVLIAGFATLALSPVPLLAQANHHGGVKRPTTDHEFVMRAVEADMAEIEVGKIAEKQSSSDLVKRFATRMIADHEKALSELRPLARNQNIPLPLAINPGDRALKDHLEVLSGREFDRAYMSAMIKDHRDDINEYRAEARHGRDDEVKRFAAKALPTLEAHLRLARDTDKSVIGPSGKKGAKVSAS